MSKHRVVQVYGTDGSALYVDGHKVSDYYTCGQAEIVLALGFKVKPLRLNQDWYNKQIKMPMLLKHCKFDKQTKGK